MKMLNLNDGKINMKRDVGIVYKLLEENQY